MKWGERENEPFWNERPTVAKVNHYDDDEYDHHQWSSLHSGSTHTNETKKKKKKKKESDH